MILGNCLRHSLIIDIRVGNIPKHLDYLLNFSKPLTPTSDHLSKRLMVSNCIRVKTPRLLKIHLSLLI